MFTRRQKHTHRYSIAPHVRVAVAAGLLCLAALAGAANARADSIVTTGNPPLSMLVKFDDRDYEIAYQDWVSLDPISTSSVRKIGFGQISEVSIATTDTGTYSSDGMISPHVLYPGIEVSRVRGESELGWHHPYSPFHIGPAGTSIYSISRSPAGNHVFSAITPVGSKVCSSSGSFTACSVTR